MARRRTYTVTDEMRALACRLRGDEKLTCREIGERLGISESVASKLTKEVPVEKLRKHSRHTVRHPRVSKAEEKAPRVSRYSHPPGHPETWSLLVQGTSLEGMEYPGG